MKCAIYVRVSKGDEDELQILENQRTKAIEYAENHEFEIHKIYEDVCSGGKEDRPGLNELRQDARRREFKIAVFTSLSRMTRQGIRGALHILNELEANGVGWHFVDQPILNYDANTPKLAKDIILSVLSAVDEDYRLNISKATKAALKRRQALGIKLGRPRKEKKATP